MSLIVMKFGGTSVATAESRRSAIDHVKAELRSGNRAVVVVSAMGRKGAPYATDTLLGLLQGEDPLVKDQLISCGETISACVFADELARSGVPARPFTGESARIVTDAVFGGASVTGMDVGPLTEALAQGLVPVVTGFQGRTPERFTTTLGRGGSDTSAVIIGGYLKADVVDIYTDVPGVAKADPRIVPQAAFMDSISQEDMLLLAQWGSGVIHPKAVQAAMDFRVPLLRVRSTFDDKPGTAIGTASAPGLAGIAVLKDLGKVPEEGRAFADSLPGDSAVVTVVYHGSVVPVLEAAGFCPVKTDGDVVHIGGPCEEIGEIAGKIYRKLN
jgi:aspartate kinase